jgi:hypothetical protein
VTILNWHTPLATLQAKLNTLPPLLISGISDPARVAGEAIKARFELYGPVYDAVYSTPIDNAKASGDATFAAAITDWQTRTVAAFGRLDTAAKTIELAQKNANVAASLVQPYVATVDGARYVMTPALTTPLNTSEIPDPALTVSAGLTLTASATPVLRLTTKIPGRSGNNVHASVTTVAGSTTLLFESFSGLPAPPGPLVVPNVNGTLSVTTLDCVLFITPSVHDTIVGQVNLISPSTVTITVTLDGYTEIYAVPSVGAKIDVKQSLLLATAEWFTGAASMPDAIGSTAFSGGVGGSIAAVKTRLSRATKLPACDDDTRAIVAAYPTTLDQLAASKPTYPVTPDSFAYAKKPMATIFNGIDAAEGVVTGLPAGTQAQYVSVYDLEQQLNAAIASATDFEAVT